MRPCELAAQLMCSVPGVQHRTAETLIGEFGIDVSGFPSEKHFVSWAAQCPGNNETAGKRKSGKTRKGPEHHNAALNDAAMGAIRVKDSHFARKYRRVKARPCHGVALGAVKHSLLIAIYYMLRNGELYHPPIVHWPDPGGSVRPL